MGLFMSLVLRVNFIKFLDPCLCKYVLKLVQERGKWNCRFMPMFYMILLVFYCTNSYTCLILIEWDLSYPFAFAFVPTVLWCLWPSECSFVLLRMIYKTSIWCNQILIVKHQWSAACITSRMIFLKEYS